MAPEALGGERPGPSPLPTPHSPLPAVGVLGGTFDPIHLGHLILAEQARTRLGLQRVLFVPAGQPWRKVGRRIAPVSDRVAMVRAALAGDPYFEVSLVESERRGPSYTVETLEALHALLGPSVELCFIMGQDALADLPHWRDPARIATLARLVVAVRAGWSAAGLPALERAVPGISTRIEVIPMPQVEISSTDIRHRIAAGVSTRFLVPAAVEAYIHEHRLYRAVSADGSRKAGG
jgi:nicotinate-nucleotide adenylyltransferase